MLIPGNVSLFEGIKSDEITRLLSCLDIRHRSFPKGTTIIHEGDQVEFIGVILIGFIQIVRTDINGNRMIQSGFGSGALFAESFVCAGIVQSPVSVVAVEDSEILFIPYKKMMHSCKQTCSFHYQLIENMLKVIALKNLGLNGKIEILSKRTLREKILTYLQQEKRKNRSVSFNIPFSRNELADYLCVDRSSLSRELGFLQNEGLISFERNLFTLQ